MALVWYDETQNGLIGAPKEGEATKLDFFFKEFIFDVSEDGNSIFCHFWVDEEQKSLYLYKGKKGTAVVPGHIGYILDVNSKELGVQCAAKAIQLLEQGKCYKGKFTIDGELGAAKNMLEKPEMIAMMSEMFVAVEEVEAENLDPEKCKAIAAKKGFGGGGFRGETQAQKIAARETAFIALVEDKERMDLHRMNLTLWLGTEPMAEQMLTLLKTLLA